MIVTFGLAALAGYLLGSIPFAYLLARAATGEDLRRVGSGNVGAANVLRRAGWGPGLAALALDAGKGAAAAWVGARLVAASGAPGAEHAAGVAVVAGLAAIIGHVYPMWLGFEGGKGVATGAGVFAVLSPVMLLGAAAAFLVILWRTRYVSLASIAGAVLIPVLTIVDGAPWPVWIGACAASALVLFEHRENLARLRGGREARLGDGRRR